MTTRTILTPFFLDAFQPGLAGLKEPGWEVNNPPLEGDSTQRRMSVLHRGLANRVQSVAEAGELPVNVAGDCCSAIGVLAGLQRAGIEPQVLWFDGHGDFNTWDTSPSGFLGGMPLAMIAGLGEQSMLQSVGLQPVNADLIVLSDGRDLDEGERMLVDGSGLHHAEDVGQVMDQLSKNRPLYVHFDTDVITPEQAPAMRYTAAGGPGADQLRPVFEQLAETGRIAAITVSAWDPELDGDGQTKAVSMQLLQALLGDNRR